MTFPITTPQRHTTDSSRSRRARCDAAKRAAAATELRRAAQRAQTVIAEETSVVAPAPAPRQSSPDRARERATAAASARSARVADAVVAQWLLEQVPRHGARRMRAAA